MAVRLGTQDWINPGPFQAAAEMVVDAGRATGAGIAALGAGIGQGLQNRQARQERAQNRQDALDQRGIDNARADRAEARMLKQSKLAASESILAAKKMNLDMASKMYEAMGTPEAEAAMLKAQQDFQEANNWYQVSVGNNAEIEPPQAVVTDYLGVGGARGPGGWPVGQSPSEKAARGEPTGDSTVYWNAKDYAESDAAQARVGVQDDSRQAAMAMASEAGPVPAQPARAADDSDEAVLGRAIAREEALRAKAGRYKGNQRILNEWEDAKRVRETLELGYAKKVKDREIAVAAEAKVAEEQRKSAADNAALRKLVNPETGRPYLSMAEPDLPAAAASILINNAKVAGGAEARLPSQMALQGQRASDALAKQDDQQKFVMEKMAKAQEYAQTRMAQAKQNRIDIAAEARAAGIPMDQFRTLFSEIDALSGQQQQLFGRAQDLADMGRMGEAQAVLNQAQGMDGDLNEMMRQLRDARLKIGQGAPATSAPMDRESARAIFDREVKARGIDPTSDAARQLAADIKAGKVR